MSSQAKLLLEATFGLQALRMSPIGNPGSDSGDPQESIINYENENTQAFINSINVRQSPAYVIWKIVQSSNVEDPENITVADYKKLVHQWRGILKINKMIESEKDRRIFLGLIELNNEENTLEDRGDFSLSYFIPNPITKWELIVDLVENNEMEMAESALDELKDTYRGREINYMTDAIVDGFQKMWVQLTKSREMILVLYDKSKEGESNDTLITRQDYTKFLEDYPIRGNISLGFPADSTPKSKSKPEFGKLIDELNTLNAKSTFTEEDKEKFEDLKRIFSEIGFLVGKGYLKPLTTRIGRKLNKKKPKPTPMVTGPESARPQRRGMDTATDPDPSRETMPRGPMDTSRVFRSTEQTAMNTSEEFSSTPQSERTAPRRRERTLFPVTTLSPPKRSTSFDASGQERESTDGPPQKRRERYILREDLRKEKLIICLQKYIMDGSLSQDLLHKLVQHPNLDTKDINDVIKTSLTNLSANIPDFVIGTTEEQIKDFFNILDRLEHIEKFSMTPDDFEDKVQDYMKENIQKFNNNLGEYIVIIDKAQGVYKASIAENFGRSGRTEVYVYENKNIRLLRENATKKLVDWVAENRQERERRFKALLPSYVKDEKNGRGLFYIKKFFNDERQSIQPVETNDEQKKEMNALEYLYHIDEEANVNDIKKNIDEKHQFIRETVLAFGKRSKLQIRFAASIKHFI